MVYKNGIKEYTLTMFVFGIPMGILLGLMHMSLLYGLFSGLICGGLFTLLIFLFVKIQEKKNAIRRLEIAKERKIFCDGGATYDGNGGWLFFTEYGLEFYPHKLNFSNEYLMIPLSSIRTVSTNKNQLVVEKTAISTSDNAKFTIIVSHGDEWVQQIKKYI